LATVIGAQAFLTETQYSPITFLPAEDELNDAAKAEQGREPDGRKPLYLEPMVE
jgi:hypothetical protein